MKRIIVSEEIGQFAAGIAALYLLHPSFSWWAWIPLFLSPDIGAIGYLAGPAAGAFTYNLCHHKGIALMLAAAGLIFHMPVLELAGILIFTHACFDRMLGYGLKYPDHFKHTHLGYLGLGTQS